MSKIHVCNVCDRTFGRKFNLQRHTKTKHNNKNIIGYAKRSNTNEHFSGYGFTQRKPESVLTNVTANHAKSIQLKYPGHEIYKESDILWKHPFTCIIAGPTGSGKSTFIARFLKHVDDIVDTPIHEIIYCAPETSYPDLSECRTPVRYLDWIPDSAVFKDKKPRLIIVDDMMRESNERVVDLFTKNSHHLGLSVIFITQNIFHKGKGMRDISLNSQYIVAYKSPRDRGQFAALARQICPGNTKFAIEVFEHATKVPYGYLVIDLTQTTPDQLRYRAKIFPDDEPSNVVYVPKTMVTW